MDPNQFRPDFTTSRQYRVLAERYSADSQILLEAKRWSTTYYLAGFSVECALKACATRRIPAKSIPDKKWLLNKFFTHDLNHLLACAGLNQALKHHADNSPVFSKNWVQGVLKWSSESRYSEVSPAAARELVRAVNDEQDGVLPWLKNFW